MTMQVGTAATREQRPRNTQVIGSVVLSGVLFYLSTGLNEVWQLAWLAPLPILLLAISRPNLSKTLVFIASALAYFLGELNLFGYLSRVLPLPIVLLLFLLPALVFAACVLFARHIVARIHPALAIFGFPCAWTAYEFLVSLVSPHGTALSLAYTQTDFLVLLQLVSITGIWGVTFVLMLVPSAITVVWTSRNPRALAPALVFLAFVISIGIFRLSKPATSETVRVGLAATDENLDRAFNTEDTDFARQVVHGYVDRIARLASQHAQLVVLPEKFVGVTPNDSPEITSLLSQAARSNKVTVIAGLNRVGIKPLRNVAVVFAPDGRILTEYEKHHLLPGPETGYAVGSIPGSFGDAGSSWAVQICKDMDFQSWSRQYATNGTRLLAVPAWDFVQDARFHSRMAVVRGVENGFAIARVAQQGNLTFSDAYGRILAEVHSSDKRDVLLVHDLPAGPGQTFYTRTGDWFAWINIFALVLLATMAQMNKTKPAA